MKSVCVIVVNWNGWGDTIECLESLFRLEGTQPTVVVVDNGSNDGSPERIAQWARGELDALPPHDRRLVSLVTPPCRKPVRLSIVAGDDVGEYGESASQEPSLVLMRNLSNEGFAGGNNRGIRFALANGADFIWLLNNDTVVAADALHTLLQRMEEVPSCGMCGSTLLFYHDPGRVQAYGGGYYAALFGLSWHIGFLRRFRSPPAASRGERCMNYVVGASLCVTRQFVEEIGPMNEDYFVFFEEVDWAFRSRGKYRLAYAPASIVYHKVGKSIGTSSNPLKKSSLCDFYNLRNRLRFTRRYSAWALPGVYAVLGFGILLRLLLGQWQQAYMACQVLGGRERVPEGSFGR